VNPFINHIASGGELCELLTNGDANSFGGLDVFLAWLFIPDTAMVAGGEGSCSLFGIDFIDREPIGSGDFEDFFDQPLGNFGDGWHRSWSAHDTFFVGGGFDYAFRLFRISSHILVIHSASLGEWILIGVPHT